MRRYFVNETMPGNNLHGVGTAIAIQDIGQHLTLISCGSLHPNNVSHPLVLRDDDGNSISVEFEALYDVPGATTPVAVAPFVSQVRRI